MENILLLGGGGRECTLAWKIAQSPLCNKLFIAPGNAGTGNYGTNLEVSVTDFETIKKLCRQYDITMLVVGPEDPLVAGIRDYFENDSLLKYIKVVGPSQEGAQLEGSKAFSKKFMQRHSIPTAAYREFTKDNYEEGIAYIKNAQPPFVLKADGLAAGKGVIITSDTEEAIAAFRSMILDAQFGRAGDKVVIEQFLDGIELSVFALTDGRHYVLLPEAKDYKRVGEGDTGLNTGGMGAVSPVPFADKAFMDKVISRIVEPTVQGLAKENISYKGFIFFGLIKVNEDPYVIEYNCRMGDPETEVVIPRLKNDLVDLFNMMHDGKLDHVKIEHDKQVAATVMLVAGGYPGAYKKGDVMTGLSDVLGSMLLHAGTTIRDQQIVTNGGRVLAITSMGDSLKDALNRSYENAQIVQYNGKYYRGDIGWEFL